MTTFTVPPDTYSVVMAACDAAFGRHPTGGGDAANTYSYDPDLTPAQLVTLQGILDAAKAAVGMSGSEYDAIRPQIQSLRDFRQLGRNAFIALAQNERDRQLYDAQTATTIILLALLRSS